MNFIKKCINENCKRFCNQPVVSDDGASYDPPENFCDLFADVTECDMHETLEPVGSDWHKNWRNITNN